MELTYNRQQWKQWFVLAVLIYLFFQSCFPLIERMTLWGEIFTLIILFVSLKFSLYPKTNHKPILLAIAVWTFLLPFYGILISKIFWNKEFELIFLIRHLVFFYYAVFFFFAFKYAPIIIDYFNKYTPFLCFFVPFALFFMGGNSLGFSPLFGFMLMGASQCFKTKKAYCWVLFLVFILLFQYRGGGTGKVMLAFALAFFLLNRIAIVWTRLIPPLLSRILIYSGFLLMGYIAINALFRFYEFTTQLALLGEGLSALEGVSKDFYTDLSGLWRPVLWSHLYGRFLHHPLGLGIGTPLFENWLDGFVMLHLNKPGENYVQGAHNSFVTFIARLGFPALLIMTYSAFHSMKLARKAFKKLGFRPLETQMGRLLVGAFFSFIFMVIAASFNVALESPLFAAIFWFSFGLFVRLFGDFTTSSSREKPDTVLPEGAQKSAEAYKFA